VFGGRSERESRVSRWKWKWTCVGVKVKYVSESEVKVEVEVEVKEVAVSSTGRQQASKHVLSWQSADQAKERERGRQHRERREACVIPSKERAGTEALRLGPAELDVRCCE
jgi:hypothetical protein